MLTTSASTPPLNGYDWGGVVAYMYAAQFRDAVDRLAVLDVLLPTKQLE
jgi:pimeloyl-ACP methyl ester carboxylesterase